MQTMSTPATTTTTASRRPKWQYPPAPPTPRIIHLPRRPRWKPPKANASKPGLQRDRTGKLEELFDQERAFARGGGEVVVVGGGGGGGGEVVEERRERVVAEAGRVSVAVAVEEEKWRFQAEMLRAECNLLRMEREIAVKKMERMRVQMERTLRSAVQTLIAGRKKIHEGKNVTMVIEEGIKELADKLKKLQRRSGVVDLEVRKFSNFDKQASLIQRRLEKFGGILDEICVKEIREMAEVEILRRKMVGLSRGILLGRMEEEYGSMLNSYDASSASTSKRIEFPDRSSFSIREPSKEKMSHEEKTCSGHCKAIVRRIVEQVRAETEQWSQMQEMLGQVRDEMEELQASRDFWEDRALDADYQIRSLHSSVQEWRQKSVSSEAKATELQAQVSMLCAELESLRKEQVSEPARAKNIAPYSRDFSPDLQNETEKTVLICHLKENHPNKDDCCNQKEVLRDCRRKAHTSTSGRAATKRSPFRDIGNSSSPLMRQNSRAIFPLHSPLPDRK